MEKNIKMYIYVYTYMDISTKSTESLCYTPETNTTLYINYISI